MTGEEWKPLVVVRAEPEGPVSFELHFDADEWEQLDADERDERVSERVEGGEFDAVYVNAYVWEVDAEADVQELRGLSG